MSVIICMLKLLDPTLKGLWCVVGNFEWEFNSIKLLGLIRDVKFHQTN